MSRALHPLVALVAALVFAGPAAAADTTWTRLTDTLAQPVNGVPLQLVFDGTTVTGTWVVRSGQDGVEVVRFQPSRAVDAANLVRTRPPALTGWDNIEAEPLAAPGGGLQLLVTGSFGVSSAPPTGTSLTPLDAAGGVGALTAVAPQNTGNLTAVLGPQGVIWVATFLSALHVYREGVGDVALLTGGTSATPAATGAGLGYLPELAYDRGGRLWLAFYGASSTPDATGVYVLQLDPSTGAPLGPAAVAPRSSAVDNNGFAVALACADACRVVYQETRTDVELSSERIVSWAPGEAAPTLVAAAGNDVRRREVAAAYRADGRLWVAWDENGGGALRYRAKLGDARGAGGRVVEAGSPPQSRIELNEGLGLQAVSVGQDLLLVSNWRNTNAGPTALWANVVVPAGVVDTTGVAHPHIVRNPGGAIVYPGTIGAADLGPGRCVRVKAVADKPARIWAQIFSGARGGSPASNRVRLRFTAPGSKTACLKLVHRRAGFFRGKRWRIKFDVRTGANAKRAERTRPPWRTQPRLRINL